MIPTRFHYRPGGQDAVHKADGLRCRGGSQKRSLEVVWILPIPTPNHTFGFNQCNCPGRPYLSRTRTTDSKTGPGYGGPPPPAVPDCRNRLGERPRGDAWKRKSRYPGRKGSRKVRLVAHYISGLLEATGIREVPDEQEEVG